MKLFKLIMLFLAGACTISSAAGQANASINILTQNTGIVNQGGTVFLQVTVNNTGPISPISGYKIRAQISVPSTIASIAATGHTLPNGWTILNNDGSTIRLSNGTDNIAVNDARTILIAVQGIALGGPSTISGQLSFSNGNPPGTAPGVLAGDNTADNSSTSTIQVVSTPVCTLTLKDTAGKIACNGGTTTLTATVSGAKGPVEYSLNGGAFQSSNIFTVNAAGSPYTVVAREVNNQACSATTAPRTVTHPGLLVATASAPRIKCNGGTTTLTVNASGGTKGYSYSIDGGVTYQTGKTFIVNRAGSPYTITVKDARKCITTTAPVTVTQPSVITPVAVVNSPTSIQVTATGGTGPKTFVIASGPTVNTTGATSGIFTGLTGGTYTFTASDSNGCKGTSAPITLNSNIAPTVNLISPANNQIFSQGDTVRIEASASDADGTISKVEIFNGKKIVAIKRSLPYAFNLVLDTVGTYTFTARATDNLDLAKTSSARTISVVANRPPAVSRPSSDVKTALNAGVSLRLAPNPAVNVLNISSTGLLKNKPANISVISSTGVILKTLKVNSAAQTIQLNVSSLLSGTYIVKITSGDKVTYRQFVKL